MKKILLCIMDGIGINSNVKYNAVYNAKTPNMDRIYKEYPSCQLDASGENVGISRNEAGNSEIGHLNIGAGRIVYNPLEYINCRIKDGTFFNNNELKLCINHTKKYNSNLHLIGLLSDVGIHSHINHLFNLLKMAKENKIENVYIHIFTDGRDVGPYSAMKYIDKLNEKIKEIGIGTIATISGRYYGMDKNNRWDRIEKVYKVMTEESSNKDVISVLNKYQKNSITDEFIIPTRTSDKGIVREGDSLIFFNYRQDSLREIINAFTSKDFNKFKRKKLNNINVVSFMPVDGTFDIAYAFSFPNLDNTLGEYISRQGFTQLRMAESEKFDYVTFFFDGKKDINLEGEKKININSPKVPTYDLCPEMSAYEITNILLKEINTNHEDFIVLNYANGDMVGHTGNYKACIKAVETLDSCIGKIMNNINLEEYTIIFTSDHGNCENMENCSHTTNKVPFIVTDKNILLNNGKLGDIAPTILKIMNLNIPKEMTGNILIK